MAALLAAALAKLGEHRAAQMLCSLLRPHAAGQTRRRIAATLKKTRRAGSPCANLSQLVAILAQHTVASTAPVPNTAHSSSFNVAAFVERGHICMRERKLGMAVGYFGYAIAWFGAGQVI